MNEITYDPSEYVRGLQQLLVSDKKRIAFLFGAGTSYAKKDKGSFFIPLMSGMTEMVVKELSKNEKYKVAINEIANEIGKENFNVESLLSNLEQKSQVVGKGKLNNLGVKNIRDLIKRIKELIKNIVSVHKKIIEENGVKELLHSDFAEWIGRIDRKFPIEIFTTNYDYFFELAFESKSIPFYDGFTGSYKPFFNSESIEDLAFLPKQTKLWKLHGSLGWHLSSDNKTVWRTDCSEEDILIYPSTLKYSDSRKQPYLSLMDRLTNFIRQPDTILITCGYSFNDEHINERIITALNSNISGHVYALYYNLTDKINNENEKDSVIYKLARSNSKISLLSSYHAIIGCQYGKWRLEKERDKDDTIDLNLYFDEDGPTNKADPIKVERKGEEIWTGKGLFLLPDFFHLIRFLKSMILRSELRMGDKKNE